MKKIYVLFFAVIIMKLILSPSYTDSHKKIKRDLNLITIGLAGDTMLGRLVNETITEKGYTYPWGDLLPLLHATDLNLINLETTLTKSTRPVPKVFNFKADPDKVQSLQKARIDVVNLANNHSKDFNNEGLLQTIDVLEKANIKFIGAGINSTQAQESVIIERNGIKIGILGATDNEPSWQASSNKPGTFYFSIEDPSQLLKLIKETKKKVDLLIVSLHWGPNFRIAPTQPFISVAHQIIDAGADIIHGHSAHIFQGIEIYQNKVILYDTGDFIDDYIVHQDLRNDRSFLYLITIDKNCIKQIQLIPTLISSMQVNKASDSDYQQTIKRMQNLSAKFGTQIPNTGLIKLSPTTDYCK